MAISMDELVAELSLQSHERVDFPQLRGIGPLCAVAMPEERSFDRWQASNQGAREFGYAAIGIGSRDAVDRLQEQVEIYKDFDPGDGLDRVKCFDVEGWLRDRELELSDYGELPVGDWVEPDSPNRGGLWFPFQDGVHLDPWWMGLVPAREPWQVPLALAYGNWNDCPGPVVHAGMARYWAEHYGARLIAAGPDTIEFMVDRPPSSREDAIKLAKEQYLYCTDIVDQGVGTISALAVALIGCGTWNFWWD